jgi:16S rRNA (cytosine967-C5)-methyltransferase
VRPGGLLVYSVCTVEPEEGPEVAAAFLREHPEFEVQPITRWLPGNGSHAAGFLFPHKTGTDGFFIAAFRRTA